MAWIDWASKALARALAVIGLGVLLCFAVMTMADGLLRFFFASPIDAVRDAGVARCRICGRLLHSGSDRRTQQHHHPLPVQRRRPARRTGRRCRRRDPGRDRLDPDDVAVRRCSPSRRGVTGSATWMLRIPTAPVWAAVALILGISAAPADRGRHQDAARRLSGRTLARRRTERSRRSICNRR